MMRDYLFSLKQRFLAPDKLVRRRFAQFRKLLDHDRACHAALATIETIYYGGKPVDVNRLRNLYGDLAGEVQALIETLHRLTSGRFSTLDDYFSKLEFYGRFAIAPPRNPVRPPYTALLSAAYSDDRLVGGKGLRLAILATELGLPVPPGFIITTSAWHLLLAENGLRPIIDLALAEVDIDSPASLTHCSATIEDSILSAKVPQAIIDEVGDRLAGFMKAHGGLLAVRSSAVGEDSEISFAGQYRSLLQVAPVDLMQGWLTVVAGKYSPEAIVYRIRHGIDDQAASMAVVVLEMVEASVSGVLTTADPDNPELDRLALHWVPGLGVQLMSGNVVPQKITLTASAAGNGLNGERLPGGAVASLVAMARRLEDHFGVPQEIEWCIDRANRLFLLQSRDLPGMRERGASQTMTPTGQELLWRQGRQASAGVACGRIHHFVSLRALETIAPGTVLVCDTTPPELVRVMSRLAAVLVRQGSGADHFSSVAREFGVPVIVQVGAHADGLLEGEAVTVRAEDAAVYKGLTVLSGVPERRDRYRSSPVGRALAMLIDFISPLSLVDPAADNFRPEGCRSLHDIIRFAHEQGMQAMFFSNPEKMLIRPQSRMLVSSLPLDIYMVDLGEGFENDDSPGKTITLGKVRSIPFMALWSGLSDPDIDWHSHSPYDWQSYDNVALAGGVTHKSSAGLASYSLVAADYCNINLRFGYHFTLVDVFLGQDDEESSILLRFAGGGGMAAGRLLRLFFLRQILERLGFICDIKGDMLDGRLRQSGRNRTLAVVRQVGRLLGVARLKDMVLDNENQVAAMVELFFHGSKE